MTTGTLSIHSENILPIIKKWLYSDKDIFVRELVSNSSDAIRKLKVLGVSDTFRITIAIDKEEKTLTFSDNGIGMTKEEIEKYITQIAFSGAEEFIEKYQLKEEIIGHFGLGFYSSYMVSKKVAIDTLSYQKGAEPAFWSCDGSSTYTMEKGTRSQRGTTITLYIDEESSEYLQEGKIGEILRKYCLFFPYPIFFHGKEINNKEPLWLKNPSEVSDKEYIDFYHQLYPLDPAPIFWVHLNIDYPFHMKGILYFPKIHSRFDYQQSTIKLFCNRVFVSDNCKDLLPDYLMVLRGAIDSPDIPLNVSRSYLQMDTTVRQLGSHVSKKISDRLSSLYKTEKERFIEHWQDVEMIIKLGILQDEKFYERVKEFLIWKTNGGNWVSLEEYIASHPDKKIYYTGEEKDEPHLLAVYKEKKIEVLYTHPFIDTPLINFLERKKEGISFHRIDSHVDELLDPAREKTLLDSEGKTEAGRIADFVRTSLNIKDLEIEAKSLASDSLPAFLVIDEGMRRLRDYMQMTKEASPTFPDKKKFVINTNNSFVLATFRLQKDHPDIAKAIMRQIYDLTLFSQKELDIKEVPKMIARNMEVMEKLIQLKKG